MNKKTIGEKRPGTKQLRAAAEAQLVRDGSPMPALAVDKLQHEYDVNAIELEMQNEALRQTTIDLETSRNLYLDLYDFAPVGYLTLTGKGQIVSANLTAAGLFDKERARLVGQPLFRYVDAEYKERWYFLLKSMEKENRQTGVEIGFQRTGGSRFFARLDCLSVRRDGEDPVIRVSMLDLGEISSIERNARDNESQYRALYESMRDAFALTDMSGRLILSNKPYQAMLGYSEKELKEKSYADLTPDKWHAIEAQIVAEQVLSEGESGVYEKEYIHKDGTIFPVELKTVLFRDQEGRVQGMWAVVRDISERKHAEARLADSESRFRMAMRAISGVVYDWNMIGDQVYFSHRLIHLLGEIFPTGVSVRDWWDDRVHPDDRQLLKAELLSAVKTPTGRYKMAYRMRHKDGHWLHVADRGFILADAVAVRMVGSLTDISARVRAETALRTLNDSLEEQVAERSSELRERVEQLHESERFIRTTLDALSSAVAVIDEGGQIIFANEVWQDLLAQGGGSIVRDPPNYSPCLSGCKENLSQCQSRKKMDVAVTALLAGKQQDFSLEYTCLQASEVHWFQVRIERFKGSASLRLIISHEDITERKLAAEEVSRAARNYKIMLRNVELANEEHSKEIAREVHDQLGATLTMLKLGLATSKSNADLPESLNDKFSGLIELADMALQSVKRVTARLRPSMLDTLGLVAAIKWHAKEFSRMTGIETEVQVADYIKLPAERGTAIFRIVQEALTNIAKHANASKVSILGRQTKRDLIFIVNDDGVGLPADARSRNGSYGLIGMQERAGYLGGRLLLDNRPAGGTCMTLQVPIKLRGKGMEEDLLS